MERVEVDVEYFEEVLNSLSYDDINEIEQYKRQSYYELLRQLKKNNVKKVEVDEVDFNQYENEYRMIEPIHSDYREFVLKAFKNHEDNLNKTIEEHVVGDKEGFSYVSKSEMKELLDEHFKEVGGLWEEYTKGVENKFSFKESFYDLKRGLEKVAFNFKKSLADRVENVKDSLNEKVQDVKGFAKKHVNSSVNKLNNQVKALSSKLDKFIGINEVKDNKSEKEFEVSEEKVIQDIPSVSFSDEKIDKLYKEHENCFIDMLKINEFGVEEYDDRWINNPDEVEHRSFFEAQYYSSRNVLVTLGLESEESLDDLERSYKVYYEMENRRLKRAEVSKGKSSSSMELEM